MVKSALSGPARLLRQTRATIVTVMTAAPSQKYFTGFALMQKQGRLQRGDPEGVGTV